MRRLCGWRRASPPGQREELHRLRDTAPEEIVNVSWDSDSGFREERGELTHMIGVLTSQTDIGAGLDSKEMPASLWAVFPCEGAFPAVMQDTMARIYSQWLVTADYELADSLSFSFTRMEAAVPGQAYSEIWVPVREKRC